MGALLFVAPVVLVEKHSQLLSGDPQIRVIKLVRDVPPYRPVHPSLLHQSVKEAQPEQQLAELGTYRQSNNSAKKRGCVQESKHHTPRESKGRSRERGTVGVDETYLLRDDQVVP